MTCASSSRLSTSRGPGLLKYAAPSVTYTRPSRAAGVSFQPGTASSNGTSCIDRSIVNPQQEISTTSGWYATTSSHLSVRDLAPSLPSPSTPPARRTSSGFQWPVENGGSSHSSSATLG